MRKGWSIRGFAARALERRMLLARAALLWERTWPALWPVCGVAGLFVALSLMDVWRSIPGWAHLVMLLAFAAAFAAALWRCRRRLALPTPDQARRRLERKNNLEHRPLALLRDELAGDPSDPGTRGLWRLHRARMARAAKRLRVGIPEPGLARHDPLGLRAGLGLLLVVGIAAAGVEWPSRLSRAFSPDFTSGVLPAELDAWIAPPEHTGLAPILLNLGAAAQVLRVPAGSNLLGRVHGGRGTPVLKLDDEETAFERADAQTHRISAVIERGRRLAVVQSGTELGAWMLEVLPDRAPEVVFSRPPSRTMRSALRVDYEASDDYGLASIVLRLSRPEGDEALEIELPVPGLGLKEVSDSSFHDLTPHPWAGLPVLLEFVAEDGIGQRGKSERIEMVLPERIFNHPVARAIIEQRKALTVDPSRRQEIARALDAISSLPAHFYDDIVVYLALRSALGRLIHDGGAKAVAEVQDLLWDTALRIEDGSLSLAERELREAQQALLDALARDAPDAEIEDLVEALKQALDDFLQALAEQAKERAAKGETEITDPNAITMEGQDLQRILDEIRELSRTGARDAARELLARLQEMLENLRAGVMMGAQQPGDKRLGRALRELGDVMRRQQKLLDETFRDARRGLGAMPAPGPGKGGKAGRQEALRRGLGEVMRRLGEGRGKIPGGLGRAERSMLDARRALEGGQSGDAARFQSRALDQLRRGARTLIEEMMARYGALREGEGGFGRFDPNNRDPLGRPVPGREWDGGLSGESVEIPDKAGLQRARDILEELYRRAGERQRPRPELDYIDRLLKRF